MVLEFIKPLSHYLTLSTTQTLPIQHLIHGHFVEGQALLLRSGNLEEFTITTRKGYVPQGEGVMGAYPRGTYWSSRSQRRLVRGGEQVDESCMSRNLLLKKTTQGAVARESESTGCTRSFGD